MSFKKTTETYVLGAKKTHGDRYSYDLVNYINNSIKILIVCKSHGVFEQRPVNHLAGSGCPACGGRLKLSKEEFVSKSRMIYGEKYDYTDVYYINGKTKVPIICKDHGVFMQTPDSHLRNHGCPSCAGVEKLTTDIFIKSAINTHGNRYSYQKTKYINAKHRVIITCKIHGDFEQIPKRHIAGANCIKCAGVNKKTTEDFIEKAKGIHGDTYSYERSVFKGMHNPITIICHIHGEFNQLPNNHVKGVCCPSCAVSGFDNKKPAIMYYLRIDREINCPLWKIGITNLSVNDRFNPSELKYISIVKTWDFDLGLDARAMEKKILNEFREFKYVGPKFLTTKGDTELFIRDVLELDARFIADSQPDAGNKAVELFGVK